MKVFNNLLEAGFITAGCMLYDIEIPIPGTGSLMLRYYPDPDSRDGITQHDKI